MTCSTDYKAQRGPSVSCKRSPTQRLLLITAALTSSRHFTAEDKTPRPINGRSLGHTEGPRGRQGGPKAKPKTRASALRQAGVGCREGAARWGAGLRAAARRAGAGAGRQRGRGFQAAEGGGPSAARRGASLPAEHVLLSSPAHPAGGGGAAGPVLPVRGGWVDAARSSRGAHRRRLLLPGCSLRPERQAAQPQEAGLHPGPPPSPHPAAAPAGNGGGGGRGAGERCACPAPPSAGTAPLLVGGRLQPRNLFLLSSPACPAAAAVSGTRRYQRRAPRCMPPSSLSEEKEGEEKQQWTRRGRSLPPPTEEIPQNHAGFPEKEYGQEGV